MADMVQVALISVNHYYKFKSPTGKMKNFMQCTLTMQGFWKGVLPSLVMVSNPSVNYMLYEYLRARLEDWRRVLSAADGKLRRTSPAGASAKTPCAR